MPAAVVAAAGEDDAKREPASLSNREMRALTTVVSDVRAAVARLRPPARPMEVLVHADAVPALRDIYYMLSNEDPMDAMPGRNVLGKWLFASRCAIPILSAVHADGVKNPEGDCAMNRRGGPTVYQTLRLLSMLSAPIDEANEVLVPGCNLEVHIMDLKHALAATPGAIEAIVSMLQHYMERKANNDANLVPAAESRVVEARIDNILRFFRNLLTPPRSTVARELMSRDRGTHIALVGACMRADLFVTLNLLFMDHDEARNLDTRIVLLVSEIYALALRCSSARDLAATVARTRRNRSPGERAIGARQGLFSSGPNHGRSCEETVGSGSDDELDLGTDVPDNDVTCSGGGSGGGAGSRRPTEEDSDRARGAAPTFARGGSRALPGAAGGLRAALQRERSLVGGGRSVVASGRWTNRHSGSFHVVAAAAGKEGGSNDAPGTASASALNPTGRSAVAAPRAKSLTSKRIVSVRNVSSRVGKTGTAGALQAGLKISSELLCILGAKNRPKLATISGRSVVAHAIRADLVNSGTLALGEIVSDLVSDVFPVLIVELRERISSAREKNAENHWAGRRFYLTLVAIVTGFQRELASRLGMELMLDGGKGFAAKLPHGSTITDANFEVARDLDSRVFVGWEAVRDAIDIESFKLVFEAVNEAREDGREHVKELELGTAAIKEMMKLLQCMSSSPARGGSSSNGADGRQKGAVDDAKGTGDHHISVPVAKTALVITMGKRQEIATDPEIEGKSDKLGMMVEKRSGVVNTVDGSGILDGVEATDDAACQRIDAHAPAVDTENAREDRPEGGPALGKVEDNTPFSFATPLSARDIALNTLEQLFEQGPFIDTPSALAKEFDPRVHSFGHLVNAIEIAFTFTETLLGKDFTRINVARKKTKRAKSKKLRKQKVESPPANLAVDTPKDPPPAKPQSYSPADPPLAKPDANIPTDSPSTEPVAIASSAAQDDEAVIEGGSKPASDVEPLSMSGTVGSRTRKKIIEESDESDSAEVELVVGTANDGKDCQDCVEARGSCEKEIDETRAAGVDGQGKRDEDGFIKPPLNAEKTVTHIGRPSFEANDNSLSPEAALDGTEDVEMQPRDGSTLPTGGPVNDVADAMTGRGLTESSSVSKTTPDVSEELNDREKTEMQGEEWNCGGETHQGVSLEGNGADHRKNREGEDKCGEGAEIAEMETEISKKLDDMKDARKDVDVKKDGEASKDEDANDNEGENDASSDESEEESGIGEALCEVEGTDVIRRFATPKTVQHIALTIRAALCCVSGVSGSILPVPEGSKELHSLPLVAKSLVVLQSVWKVAGSRDRGAFRCAYFNYATLHLFGIAMATAESQRAKEDTILGKLAEFGRDVTQEFYKVLTVNPALLMDTLFFPDISTQRLYASKMHQKSIMAAEEEARARGELKGTDEESSEEDSDAITKRKKRAPRKKSVRQRNIERQARNALRKHSVSRSRDEQSDEDVDDFENLEILQKLDSHGEGASSGDDRVDRRRRPMKRSRRRLKKNDFLNDGDPSGSDGISSSSDSDDSPLVTSKSKKRARSDKRKTSSEMEEAPAAKEFSSDDEYSDDALRAFASAFANDATENERPLDDGIPVPNAYRGESSDYGKADTAAGPEALEHTNVSPESTDEVGELAAPSTPESTDEAREQTAPVVSSKSSGEGPFVSDTPMPAAAAELKGRILLDGSDYGSE